MPPRKVESAVTGGETSANANKALQAALQQIERNFGKGAIMRMGDKPDVKIDSVPTGSLGLDIALGIGGVPKGRIMEIYGPESSGKCVTADTMMLSEDGLLSVEEFFEARGFRATNTTRIVPHAAKLVNEKGEWESTSHLTWNGKRKVRRIETGIGSELGLTLRHPIRVMDDNGFIVWKNGEDIVEGDIVPVMRGTQSFPSSDKITQDEACLLGYLIADGCNSPTSRVGFSNSDDDVIEDYRRITMKLFPEKEMVSYPKGGDSLTIDHHINSKEFRTQLFDKLGLEYHLAVDKQVPACVRRSGKDVQIAFLRSYIELECSLDSSKRSVEVSGASRNLLLQVQAMLLNMGIVSMLRPKPVGEVMYWRLTASGEQGVALVRLLDFRTSARRRSVELFADETNGSTNIDSVPFMGRMLRSLYHWCTEKNSALAGMVCDYIGDIPRARLTYPRLRMIVDAFEKYHGVGSHPILMHFRDILDSNYFYTSVESIRETVEPTFDVCMPRTHSFWSNALISHNTTMALHILAEFQKQGAVCAFIDAEHALDPAYARKLGVDVDNLLLSQPDNGEQALEIVDTLVRSGGIGFIVVDSVAALTPRAEIEGEMGDSSVGVHARLMSQGMRKLTGNISRSNCTILFINQIRMKIGVMFGSPETTTGGNALKFYASVRMDIRSIGKIKEKDDIIGHTARVKVIKNKLAPPFRIAEFEIMYGKGISRMGELVDLGVKAGIIEKSGAWFSCDSTRIGQGKENAKIYLEEHPEMAAMVEARIRGTDNLPAVVALTPVEADEAAEDDEADE